VLGPKVVRGIGHLRKTRGRLAASRAGRIPLPRAT
jgi:hypothetical protein